ncbi:hypothetical protein D3C84_636040 [compost metagenome]
MTEDQPVVLQVVLQRHFPAAALQVGRAGTQENAVFHQRLGDHAGQVGGAIAQGEVVATVDQVDVVVAQVHFQMHMRVLAEEAAADGVEEGRAEGRRCRDAQAAAHLVLQLFDALTGQLQLHQRLAGALQVDMPGFGE